jgi:hypothetical protein
MAQLNFRGGGYNDRQNVEYIERQDDKDEYDAFGRKKKKTQVRILFLYKKKQILHFPSFFDFICASKIVSVKK